ncbi:hypothetical protein PSACC_03355 [Paramicrosporidium saccamoebae]|uniref:Uncharacterized protein n=1 Tax=Paramicrosporidium saccamoebae TaxID=1246581 RepID=A0A2H9TGD1_9FUNG|nr:hypothetical protein PSACC_03355 [Paramicrosporidium saccamoebae]
MNNRNIAAFDTEYYNLTCNYWAAAEHCQKKDIASLKSRRHALTKNKLQAAIKIPKHNNYRALIVQYHAQTFPNHVGRENDSREIKTLKY